MLASFYPIRIVAFEQAQTHPSRQYRDHTTVKVRVETLKRSTGPIHEMTAYIKGMENIKLDLLDPYHQPPMGIDEQTLTFGFLPDEDFRGKKLVIVIQWRMRKGIFAIVTKIPIQ